MPSSWSFLTASWMASGLMFSTAITVDPWSAIAVACCAQLAASKSAPCARTTPYGPYPQVRASLPLLLIEVPEEAPPAEPPAGCSERPQPASAS